MLVILVVCVNGTSVLADHPFTLADMFKLEDVGRTAFMMEGRYLVYELIPPFNKAPNTGTRIVQLPDESALSKLFVIDLNQPSAAPRPLFNQASNGGYWMGGPSPDGTKLAIYSLVARNIKAGVFDFKTGQLKKFSLTPNYFWLVQSAIWINANELVYPVLPEGQLPSIVGRGAFVRRLNDLWKKADMGLEPSATVMTSSVDGVKNAHVFRDGGLVRVNVKTGAEKEISRGYFYNLKQSPDGRYLAGLKEGGDIQPADEISYSGDKCRQLVVWDLQGALKESIPCPNCQVVLGSLAWSASGQSLTFLARPLQGKPQSDSLFRYATQTGSLESVDLAGFRLSCGISGKFGVRPLGDGKDILLFGHLLPKGVNTAIYSIGVCKARNDWYLLSGTELPKNLTGQYANVSSNLAGIADYAIFPVADGNVIKLGPSGVPQDLTESVVANVTVPNFRFGMGSAVYEVYATGRPLPTVRTVLENSEGTISLDLRNSDVKFVARPHSDAKFLGMDPKTGVAAFRTDSDFGSSVWVVRPGGRARQVLEFNGHLRHIATAKAVKIRYKGPDGSAISSSILLPPEWKPGKRYPMVVWVYPGSVGNCPTDAQKNHFSISNWNLLLGRGYAVLCTALPSDSVRTAEGPTLGVAQLVLKAVEQAVQDGFADGERVGIKGYSQGYLLALETVAQTDRLKAAVVGFGYSDLASNYGTIPLSRRVLPDSFSVGSFSRHELPASASASGLGVKPWEDPSRYIRNSPVFQADKIKTPVLIFHSDFDVFPIGQSEEIFAALYRLRREATYVTYHGEGHLTLGPANLRDMWQRTFAWFDEFLDISRDPKGNLVWDGEKVKSRSGALPLKPEDFARFDEMILKNSKR